MLYGTSQSAPTFEAEPEPWSLPPAALQEGAWLAHPGFYLQGSVTNTAVEKIM